MKTMATPAASSARMTSPERVSGPCVEPEDRDLRCCRDRLLDAEGIARVAPDPLDRVERREALAITLVADRIDRLVIAHHADEPRHGVGPVEDGEGRQMAPLADDDALDLVGHGDRAAGEIDQLPPARQRRQQQGQQGEDAGQTHQKRAEALSTNARPGW